MRFSFATDTNKKRTPTIWGSRQLHSTLAAPVSIFAEEMRSRTKFRFVLPIAATVATGAFGSVGLWQRHSLLNRPLWGAQTMWDSTARFHVWPLPFKFAVAANIPAFLTAGIVTLPLTSEWVGLAVMVLVVPLLWYYVGRRLDSAGDPTKAWGFVLVFTIASVACASFPFGYIAYIYLGALMWITTGFVLLTLFRKHTS